MSSFTDRLKFERISNSKNLYRTLNSFRFYYNDDKSGEYLDVPIGTIFNGASFPLSVQKFFGFDPIDSRWVQATVVHDLLVGEHREKAFVMPTCRYLSWNESADWFDKALRVKFDQLPNTPHFNRRLFVYAVKLYGLRKK